MHTAIIAAALTTGLVTAGTAVTTIDPPEPSRTVRVSVVCAEKTSSYPASVEPGVSCGLQYTGFITLDPEQRR